MRSIVLSLPVWLVLSAAAVAQGTTPANPPPSATPPAVALPPSGVRPGNDIGTGMSEPMSSKAANIDRQDRAYQNIAPNLPSPHLGPNASPVDYLHAAEDALAAGKSGETQQALEMAQTRLLDRSVPYGQTDKPINTPAIDTISKALQALAAGDRMRCVGLIQAAIPQAQAAMK